MMTKHKSYCPCASIPDSPSIEVLCVCKGSTGKSVENAAIAAGCSYKEMAGLFLDMLKNYPSHSFNFEAKSPPFVWYSLNKRKEEKMNNIEEKQKIIAGYTEAMHKIKNIAKRINCTNTELSALILSLMSEKDISIVEEYLEESTQSIFLDKVIVDNIHKDQTVKALQLRWDTWNEMCSHAGVGGLENGKPQGKQDGETIGLDIPTKEGLAHAIENDWIIRVEDKLIIAREVK